MLEILWIYRQHLEDLAKGGSCPELMLQRTGGNDASNISCGRQSTGIEWTLNREQINPGRQAQWRKVRLLRFIDFLPSSHSSFLYTDWICQPPARFCFLWSWMEMCALTYHRVLHTHACTHSGRRAAKSLPLAPPEAIQVLIIYGLNAIVRGFVLDANLILAFSVLVLPGLHYIIHWKWVEIMWLVKISVLSFF